MDEELPDEYVPTELRDPEPEPREQVVYACGFEGVGKSYAMFHGPNPDLKEMLEVVPPGDETAWKRPQSRQPVIVRFNKDGTDEVIYYWFVPRTGTPCWRRRK